MSYPRPDGRELPILYKEPDMASDRYRGDPFWRNKPLTPAQLLVQDVGLSALQPGKKAQLEINEVLTSTLVIDKSPMRGEKSLVESSVPLSLQDYGTTRTEQQKLADLQRDYGWMNSIRHPEGPSENSACRWIHVASKFPEYLQGILVGLSDWTVNPEEKVESLRQLDRCVYDHERFSMHGKYFSPFFQTLSSPQYHKDPECPVLMSIPFLDWTLFPGPTPPLRFQVDPRESRVSAHSACHPLRSLLQHYYRLEDTSDRDRTQVYAKHKPWYANREVDLKVRRWYGHHPSGLAVDELWVMVVDSRHIVTFSSNQTWKARWPPMQLTSRISDVSFRRIRDNFLNTDRTPKYNSLTHAISCVHGAVGMLHRSFWTDMPVPCTDRYGGYLSHLQYRLHRSPNTRLVKDLLQILDELNIVLELTRQQEKVISDLREYMGTPLSYVEEPSPLGRQRTLSLPRTSSPEQEDERGLPIPQIHTYDGMTASRDLGHPQIAAPRLHYAFQPPNPLDEMFDLLRREYDDLKGLRDSSNELVTRTVQLVNIRLEDHGRAILVFTVVTIIFLPLSFISSYFGMNLKGIRKTESDQGEFWIIASILTLCIVVLSLFLAFYGGYFQDKIYSRRKSRPWQKKE